VEAFTKLAHEIKHELIKSRKHWDIHEVRVITSSPLAWGSSPPWDRHATLDKGVSD
jgi:hypothetical protein